MNPPLASNRGQLEDHPLKLVPLPTVVRANSRVYRDDERFRLLRAAEELRSELLVRWDLLILSSLCMGMRKAELLNLTWRDIDFERKMAEASPKKNTEHTWEWHTKDSDRRKLPLSDDLVERARPIANLLQLAFRIESGSGPSDVSDC